MFRRVKKERKKEREIKKITKNGKFEFPPPYLYPIILFSLLENLFFIMSIVFKEEKESRIKKIKFYFQKVKEISFPLRVEKRAKAKRRKKKVEKTRKTPKLTEWSVQKW